MTKPYIEITANILSSMAGDSLRQKPKTRLFAKKKYIYIYKTIF